MTNGNTFTLTLPLRLNDNEIRYFDHVFFLYNHIYNIGVKETKRRLNKLLKDPFYNKMMTDHFHHKDKFSKEDKKILLELRKKYDLSNKSFLEKYLKSCRYKYDNYISSTMVQGISNRLYASVQKFLFDKGKTIHFKRYKDLKSLSEKSNLTGFKYKYNKAVYMNKTYPVSIRTDYEKECLLSPIKYCRIKRKWHKHKYRYYIELNFKGSPPLKQKFKDLAYIKGKVGIDIGPSTIAITSDHGLIFKELDDGINKIDKEIKRLNRKADRQRRSNNPQNYNDDGTIKRNTKSFKRIWYTSKSLKLTYDKIKHLYSKRANKLRYFHHLLALKICGIGNEIYIETMDLKSLQKRVKETKKNSKGKYKKKKRFGTSILLHAPAQFISILDQKIFKKDGVLYKIDTKTFKASQFNHLTGEYIKSDLNDRWKELSDNILIQRDLYSSYLLSHIEGNEYDLISLKIDFNEFKERHDELLKQLYDEKLNGKHFPSCMGISKRYIEKLN